MKIGIIGANGRLGSKIVMEALKRGYEVRSFIVTGEGTDPREEVINKSLFDLEKEDFVGVDIVLSAFGGGFHADPVINKQAYEKYVDLEEKTGLRFITIAGAGTMYCDKTHTKREYENMDQSKPLYQISMNICAGVNEIRNRTDLHWTVVSPSQRFDFEGERHDEYVIGTDEELLFNSKGESYLTYEDMACAFVDMCESDELDHKIVTVLSKI